MSSNINTIIYGSRHEILLRKIRELKSKSDDFGIQLDGITEELDNIRKDDNNKEKGKLKKLMEISKQITKNLIFVKKTIEQIKPQISDEVLDDLDHDTLTCMQETEEIKFESISLDLLEVVDKYEEKLRFLTTIPIHVIDVKIFNETYAKLKNCLITFRERQCNFEKIIIPKFLSFMEEQTSILNMLSIDGLGERIFHDTFAEMREIMAEYRRKRKESKPIDIPLKKK